MAVEAPPVAGEPPAAEDDAVAAWLRGRIAWQRQPGVWHISLQGVVDGDRCLAALGAALPEDLTALQVEVPASSSPSEVGFRSLAQRLDRPRNLTRLELRCPMCDGLTDAAVKALCRPLSALHRLEALLLDFALCQNLCDGGIEALSIVLSDKGAAESKHDAAAAAAEDGEESPSTHPVLKRFEMNLHACKRITDAGLGKLAGGIGSMRHVSSFVFTFAEPGSQVSSPGLRPLVEAVQSMADLEQLALVFQDCLEFQESCLVVLCQALTQKEKLKVLALNFHGCREITSAGLVLFNEVFKEAHALERVSLDVTLCDKVANKGIEEFCTYLRQKKHLKSLILHIGGTNVGQSAMPLLYKEMGGLDKFEVSVAIRTSSFIGLGVLLS